MPVAKIAEMAHAHGIEVLCDGAHSFGLIDFKIPDLNCDYFGTSLHKFLSAPIGTGMMWVKSEKDRKNLAARLQRPPALRGHPQVRRPRHAQFPSRTGHRRGAQLPRTASGQAQASAHRLSEELLGVARAIEPKVKLHTSLNLKYSCAICGVSVDGMTPSELENALFNHYKIHTVGIVWENISACASRRTSTHRSPTWISWSARWTRSVRRRELFWMACPYRVCASGVVRIVDNSLRIPHRHTAATITRCHSERSEESAVAFGDALSF